MEIKFISLIIWSKFIFIIENMRYGKWVQFFPVSPCQSHQLFRVYPDNAIISNSSVHYYNYRSQEIHMLSIGKYHLLCCYCKCNFQTMKNKLNPILNHFKICIMHVRSLHAVILLIKLNFISEESHILHEFCFPN